MASATSGYLTARFGSNAGQTFESEVWQIGWRLRAGGADYDVSGTLPPFDVTSGYEEEDAGTYQVTWANWTPDGIGPQFGFTQYAQKLLVDQVLTWWNTQRTNHTTQTFLKELRFGLVDRFGKTIDGAQNRFVVKSPQGGTQTGFLPVNSAMAVSLDARSRGRKGHGRVFLPGLGQNTITTGGIFGGTVRGNVANLMATLVRDLNAVTVKPNPAIETAGTVAIVSLTRQDYADVHQVRVGDEPDVQNRRRNARDEVYTTVVV